MFVENKNELNVSIEGMGITGELSSAGEFVSLNLYMLDLGRLWCDGDDELWKFMMKSAKWGWRNQLVAGFFLLP